MFFVREIKYLYYYEKHKKVCSAGTCKLRTQGDRLVMDFYLKRLHASYPIRTKVKLVLEKRGVLGEEHMLIAEQKVEYRIVFACEKISEDRPEFYSFVAIGEDKFICDEETWNMYLSVQGEKKEEKPDEEETEVEKTEGEEKTEEKEKSDEEKPEEEEKSEGEERTEGKEKSDEEKPEEEEKSEVEEKPKEYVTECMRDETVECSKEDDSYDPATQQKEIIHIPDENGIKQEYYVLKPEELARFGTDFAEFMENSFLLHGYYNYHHIILGPVAKSDAARMRIGVPGNYYYREEMVAAMFNFLSFVSVKGDKRTGAYGYYFTEEMF